MIAYEEETCEQKPEERVFEGFTAPTNEDYFTTLHYWKMIGAYINSLAEYKVIDYILQVTWGTGNPYNRVPLTIESLMNGYVDEEGVQIDNGTGLSRQSVITGLEKAIRHGLIERHVEYWIDEEGRTRATRYYGLHFYQPAEVYNLDLADYPQEDTVEIVDSLPDETGQVYNLDFGNNQPVEPFEDESQEFRLSSNEFERHTHNNNSMDGIRIQEDHHLDSDQKKRTCNRLQTLSREDNATLCNRIESLSNALGDHEHTASNIGQVRRILAEYQARGGEFEAFLLLMYEARDLARKKTNIRRPNRMPYFFACLKKSAIVTSNC